METLSTASHFYRYPHPAVTTDAVIFTIGSGLLMLPLVRRAHQPFENCWALPGGYVEIDEDLDTAAARELAEETGIQGIYLEQLYTFGAPHRDPRERVISVAYLGLAPFDRLALSAGSDAAQARWFDVRALPVLAFDHDRIIALAHQRLVNKLGYSTIALQLLPAEFTLRELQAVYETILGRMLDKRNFRKHVLGLGCLSETGHSSRNGAHRPARLYRLRSPGRVEFFR
jgi:8-oxo-dGTP diphosphatase